jgi:hypothetical protein
MRIKEVKMGRGIKFTKFVQKIKEQKDKFGKSNPPGHPDPEIFREGNLDQAAEYMAFWKIEPSWGDPAATGEPRLIYRSIPGSKATFMFVTLLMTSNFGLEDWVS